MDPQKFGDSYDFVKSVPRQLFLQACCLIEKCYRKISTWDHPPSALFPAFHRGPATLLRTRHRPACRP